MGCKCKDKELGYTPMITCSCGLKRLLPSKIRHGQRFHLVPCPLCGAAFKGKFLGNRVIADA